VIKKRGAPKGVLLSIHDYVRLRAPKPEVLRVIGEESRRKGTDMLTSPPARKNRSSDDSAALGYSEP